MNPNTAGKGNHVFHPPSKFNRKINLPNLIIVYLVTNNSKERMLHVTTAAP
jgi:hypothetical protein